jgi:hypothetical protein
MRVPITSNRVRILAIIGGVNSLHVQGLPQVVVTTSADVALLGQAEKLDSSCHVQMSRTGNDVESLVTTSKVWLCRGVLMAFLRAGKITIWVSLGLDADHGLGGPLACR